jgi:hypothetical protein
MKMMRGRLAASSKGTQASVRRAVLVTLTSNVIAKVFRIDAGVVSGAAGAMPALLTRTSRRPAWDLIVEMQEAMEESEDMSSWIAEALLVGWETALIPSRAFLPFSRLREPMKTWRFEWSVSSFLAISKPMPVLAPEMRMTV